MISSEDSKMLDDLVCGGDVKMVKVFLQEKKIDLTNLRVEHEPLGYAVLRKDWPMINFLLQEGAPVNGLPRGAMIPLLIAVSLDDLVMTKFLLEQGADPNVTWGAWESSPLIEAADNGNKSIVEALLGRGADPNYRDLTGNTAKQYASNRDHYDLADLLE